MGRARAANPCVTEEPQISVVIPTHNRWPLLSTGALRSALGQEDVRHEVIVVDDGSSDDTPARLKEIEAPTLHILRHERPLGVAHARNTGIAAARGQWIAFLDDDDFWSPRKLRNQLDTAGAMDASFVYSDVLVLNLRRHASYLLTAPESDGLHSEFLKRYAVPGGPSNMMAETELVRLVGGFDEHLFMTADWDFWIRLARAGRGARCPLVLVANRAHASNMPMRSRWSDLMRDLDYFLGKHGSNGLTVTKAGFARWLALERNQSGKRIEAALRLTWLGLRFGRPRYVLQALGLFVPRPRRTAEDSDQPVREPDWVARFLISDDAA